MKSVRALGSLHICIVLHPDIAYGEQQVKASTGVIAADKVQVIKTRKNPRLHRKARRQLREHERELHLTQQELKEDRREANK